MSVVFAFALAGSVVVLFLSCLFLALVGGNPRRRRGPVASLFRLVFIRIPTALERACPCLAGTPTGDLSQYPPYYWLMRSVFVGLFAFLILAFALVIFPCFDAELLHPLALKLFSFSIGCFPVIFYIALALADPGDILPTNVLWYHSRYSTEDSMQLDVHGSPMLPRSRFCARRNAYVARYDHYCPWLGAPIGELVAGVLSPVPGCFFVVFLARHPPFP
jgi:hypothetical protein